MVTMSAETIFKVSNAMSYAEHAYPDTLLDDTQNLKDTLLSSQGWRMTGATAKSLRFTPNRRLHHAEFTQMVPPLWSLR